MLGFHSEPGKHQCTEKSFLNVRGSNKVRGGGPIDFHMASRRVPLPFTSQEE